jgi:6-phosphogluconolactonase/glucosamine-6-phosphate isomerase/deaminase
MASCVERAVKGPVTTMLPASFLQLHRNADIFLDEDAARGLRAEDAG